LLVTSDPPAVSIISTLPWLCSPRVTSQELQSSGITTGEINLINLCTGGQVKVCVDYPAEMDGEVIPGTDIVNLAGQRGEIEAASSPENGYRP
jgi:hypothetical protein